MSPGLGKVERWILIHAYLKAMKRLPDGWQLLPDQRDKSRLFKAEVLSNYFRLERSEELLARSYAAERLKYPNGFKVTRAYEAALVSYRRATKNLRARGYVDLWTQYFWDKEFHKCGELGSGTSLTLTPSGKSKARELLNADT